MTRLAGSLILSMLWVVPAPADEAPGPFQGQWQTSIGTVNLVQKGDAVTGTYGVSGQFAIKGTVRGKVLTFTYEEGKLKGDGRFALDERGHSFAGSFQIQGGRSGVWNGWRPDPKATTGDPGHFEGPWLTDLGLMELTREGTKVTGRYASRGTTELSGDITGRRLDFRFQGFRPGAGWFDLAENGRWFAGAARTEGYGGWFGWRGRPAPEFVRHARLVAGKIVDGSTRNLLTYAALAPEGYKEESGKKWPTLILFHGSSMNAQSYVNTLAAVWPDLARDFLIIGLNGETASEIGPEPRFNYSYVNYTGKSTYKGFPGTDRESPALVSEALTELRGIYPVDHYLVGGHSQGGFLTYCILMNDPEAIAGAFPISAGVIFQCEPEAFRDAPLRQAQRAVPLAIVHGKNDPLVPFVAGASAATVFGEAGWPALHLFTDDKAGHMFARLPVGPAVRWLEALASRDPAVLLDFAGSRAQAGIPRDAIAALRRARALELIPEQKARADAIAAPLESRAAAGAKDLLPRVQSDKDGSWIDAFLAYRDDYEFADAARPLMAAFEPIRARHTAPAQTALAEANTLLRQGKKDEGAAKYREIAAKYYAAPSYRNVKRWLEEHK
jgi:predicted esterase